MDDREEGNSIASKEVHNVNARLPMLCNPSGKKMLCNEAQL